MSTLPPLACLALAALLLWLQPPRELSALLVVLAWLGICLHAKALPLEALDLQQLPQPTRLLLVASTYGDGEAPDHAARFERQLLGQHLDLRSLEYAMLGLDDLQYPQFCAFARRLDRRLRELGATPLFDRLEADRADPAVLRRWQQLGQLAGDSQFSDWQAVDYQSWTLRWRQCLNPGSRGAPVFHLQLRPDAADWQAGDGHLELLVREMRRPDGRPGLGSGWLCRHAAPGETIDLRVRATPGFRLPADCGPLILIGNGTGLASLRAHLRERARLGRHGHWLLYGERNAAHDRFFAAELEAWQRDGHLARLDLAFSRGQAEPVYVQHLLREAADELRAWLARGASLLVCGSLQGMGREVDALLHGLLGSAEVERLRETGRYRRDLY